MNKLLFFFLCLAVSSELFSQDWSEFQKIAAPDRAVSDHFSKSVSISGDFAIVGSHRTQTDELGINPIPKAGGAYIYKRENDAWTFSQKIVANDRAPEDNFGTSVSMKNDYVLVGAYKRDTTISGVFYSQMGACYVFKKSQDEGWVQSQKLIAPDFDSLDYFGKSVSITDDYMIIGAAFKNNGPLAQVGAAYIYEKDDNGNWLFAQKLVPSDNEAFSIFGWSVAIDGNIAVVGAYKNDRNEFGGQMKIDAGAAYVYERETSGNWNEVAKLVASDRAPSDYFGYSVSVSGNTIVVGAYQEDNDINGGNALQNSGSAYVFMRGNNGDWNEIQKLTAPDRASEDKFSYSLAISGENLVVGAYGADYDENGLSYNSDAGAVYFYRKHNDGQWDFIQKKTTMDRSAGDWLGFSVALDVNTAVVGAFSDKEDENGGNILMDAGSAYFYENTVATFVRETGNGGVQIYPNPVENKLYIDSKYDVSKVQVIDVYGRLVFEDNNSVGAIDFSRFPLGAFFVIIQDHYRRYSFKVIRN